MYCMNSRAREINKLINGSINLYHKSGTLRRRTYVSSKFKQENLKIQKMIDHGSGRYWDFSIFLIGILKRKAAELSYY